MRFILITIFTFNFGLVDSFYSQELFSSSIGSGGSSETITTEGNTLLVQQSIGQSSPIGSFTEEGNTIIQGFNRPLLNLTTVEPIITDNNIKLKFYPNPFIKTLNIKFSDQITDIIKLTMYDLSGKIIKTYTYIPTQTISVELNDISSGRYFLKILTSKKEFMANLIKQ